ncbi:sugar phosphate isomerase/epimerase [Chitinispirillales bacterium ANBcel5]|uniref:sugar phosphate isomerase/epimerase family protein n=1 Tax=Cellulosispirillum alkaliphilum TaxID=3039283 RepID=UPI002A4E9B69|nr:sugar phosphate isomerase/epimerase [Chitinispirillales bacterium ANBcel5]
MSDWPVGLSTGCFYQKSIFDCLEMIRDGGFCLIEVCSSPAHLNFHDIKAVKKAAVLMKKLGMEPYSFHAPFIDVDISSIDPQQREKSKNEIMRAAEAAGVLEARHFVIHPGPDNMLQFSIEERAERLRNAADVLNKVANKCQKLGVGLVLENMLPHLPFGSTSDMMWIMGAMDNLNICTCLDTGHARLSGDIYSVMYKLSGHMRIVHANDNTGKYDSHLPPGKGVIDWHKVLFELGETNFRGGIILELSGAENGDPLITLEEARQARLYLRKISKELYLSSPPSVEIPSHSVD